MTTQHSTHEMVYGAFLLGDIELAINAHELQEVVNLPDEMDKVPLSPDYLMGVFSLRESIVPVINMRVLLKQPDSPETDDARRDCIAIIRVGSNRMGLLFDRTSEVLRIGRDNIELFAYPDGDVDSRGPVQGVISLDEGSRLVQVLEPLVLLNLPGVPLSGETPADESGGQRSAVRRRCITFGSGGNRYGFRIDAVNEIIPMQELGSTGLVSDTCMGRIELRGTVLPILNFARLLDSEPDDKNTERTRIIIARVGNQPVGFKVDDVEGIIEYGADELQPLLQFGGASKVLLAGCIVEDDGSDICLIDHEKLYAIPEVTAPAEASTVSQDQIRVEAQSSQTATCLLVSLGFDFVLPVADISEIIDCPESVSPISGSPDHIEGIFNLRKKVVTVVDMRALYGIGASQSDLEPKLLIAEYHDRLVGLRVDGVKDIVKISLDKVHATPASLLAGWSEACHEDIKRVWMDETGVLPLLPLESAMERVSPPGLQSNVDIAA